jgi:hypothetical protein
MSSIAMSAGCLIGFKSRARCRSWAFLSRQPKRSRQKR